MYSREVCYTIILHIRNICPPDLKISSVEIQEIYLVLDFLKVSLRVLTLVHGKSKNINRLAKKAKFCNGRFISFDMVCQLGGLKNPIRQSLECCVH